MKRFLLLKIFTLILFQYGWAQLSISVSTDKAIYGYGETIELKGTVTNNADTSVSVVQPYQGPITKVFFDDVELSWLVLPTEISYVYSPHSSCNSIFQLDVSRLGLPNKDGPHTLTCGFYWRLNDSIFFNRDSLTTLQPTYYGGHLMVGYSVHVPPSQIQSLRDSMNAIVISSDTFGEDVYERWNTSRFILDTLVTKYFGDSRLSSIVADRSLSGPTLTTTNIIHSSLTIDGYRLLQNYPNPFNPNTTIQYSLPKTTYVTLNIYNSLGQEIARLVSQQMSAGTYTEQWDASGFASGVYYYRLETGNFIQTKKFLLIK